MKATLPLLALTAALGITARANEARAGRNLWEFTVYQSTPRDGCVVVCTGSRCTHGCNHRTVTRYGIRYRTRVQVVRATQGGLGLRVRVQATEVAGLTHRLQPFLTFDARLVRLPPFAPSRVGRGIGIPGWTSNDRFRPRATEIMTESYANDDGILPGHRLTLSVRILQVKPAGWHHTIQPRVATVVLTVPHRGQPHIRIF